MKIAISSEGKDKDSSISPMFGRSPYFLIFEDKKLKETIENPFKDLRGRAGIKTGEMLVQKGADLVVGKNIGFNVKRILEDNNVKIKITDKNKVKEVIE